MEILSRVRSGEWRVSRMRGIYVALCLLPIAAFMACAETPSQDLAGAGPAGGDTPQVSQAHEYFDQNVKPIMSGSCAYCHANAKNEYGAPPYLGNSVDLFYDRL